MSDVRRGPRTSDLGPQPSDPDLSKVAPASRRLSGGRLALRPENHHEREFGCRGPRSDVRSLKPEVRVRSPV